MNANYKYNMIEGHGKFLNRTTTAKGRKYDSYYVYIPAEVARDSANPFRPGDKIVLAQ